MRQHRYTHLTSLYYLVTRIHSGTPIALGNILSVLPLGSFGKTAGLEAIKLTGHGGRLADIAFAPWNDNVVATGEYCKISFIDHRGYHDAPI